MVKMKDADGMVDEAMPLHSRYIKTMSSDFKDKTRNKISFCVLCNGSSRLRYGC